jgi:uncharacterized protein YlxP (DUF503 family)
MVIGTCQLVLRLPENRSLKGKRQVVRSVVERVRNRFNVSVAEVEYQDRWQVCGLGIGCISSDARHADEILNKVLNFIADLDSAAVLGESRIEILHG